MNTHTSKQNIWLRSIVLLPLIAFSIYGFSEKKEVIKPLEELQESHSEYTARSISIEILEDGTYTIDGVKANKSTLISEVNKLHQDITAEIRNHIMNIHVTSSTKISNEETWFLYNSLLDYGFYRLVTPEQEVVKGKGNTPFAIEQTQQKATPEEVEEYNKLASQQNDKPIKLRIFKQKDVERMEYLYKKMSKEQKANVEPFPNIYQPPPPATSFIEVNDETLFVVHYNPKRYYNKKGYLVDKNGKTLNGNTQVNASDVLPGHYITKVYKDDKVVAEFKDNIPNQKNMKVIKGGDWNDVESYLNPYKSTKTSSQDSIPVLDFQQNPLRLSLNGKLTTMENLKEDFKKVTNNKSSDLRINAKGEVQMSFIKQIKTELGVELVKIYLDESAHILDDTISIETQITIEEKTNEKVKINGKSPINNIINLSKKEIEKAIITIDNGEIVKFNFKIPGKASESISGNALNSKAKSYLISAEIGDQIQLFMIKNSKNQVHPPILITIVE